MANSTLRQATWRLFFCTHIRRKKCANDQHVGRAIVGPRQARAGAPKLQVMQLDTISCAVARGARYVNLSFFFEFVYVSFLSQ